MASRQAEPVDPQDPKDQSVNLSEFTERSTGDSPEGIVDPPFGVNLVVSDAIPEDHFLILDSDEGQLYAPASDVHVGDIETLASEPPARDSLTYSDLQRTFETIRGGYPSQGNHEQPGRVIHHFNPSPLGSIGSIASIDIQMLGSYEVEIEFTPPSNSADGPILMNVDVLGDSGITFHIQQMINQREWEYLRDHFHSLLGARPIQVQSRRLNLDTVRVIFADITGRELRAPTSLTVDTRGERVRQEIRQHRDDFSRNFFDRAELYNSFIRANPSPVMRDLSWASDPGARETRGDPETSSGKKPGVPKERLTFGGLGI